MFVPGLDAPKYFYVQNAAFMKVGIDITSLNFFFHKPWKFVVTIASLLPITLCSGYFVCTHLGDMDQVLHALPQFMFCSLIFVKLLIFICKRDMMVNIVRKIWLMSMKATQDEKHAIIEENAKDLRMRTILLWSCIATAAACYAASLLTTAYSFIFTRELELHLPLVGTYPLDITRLHNYAIVFLWSSLAAYFGSNALVGVDCCYLWCLHNLVAQLRILQLKLKDEVLVSSCDGTQIELLLKRCICLHQQIASIVRDVQSAYRSILFVQFAVNAAQFSVNAFQLVNVTSLVRLPYVLASMLTVLVELMVFCYGGQQLQNASEDAAWAVYDAIQWDKWPVKCKKLVLIWLLRVQQPCKLRAVFFEMDFSLFLWVCQTGYSYMTALKCLA